MNPEVFVSNKHMYKHLKLNDRCFLALSTKLFLFFLSFSFVFFLELPLIRMPFFLGVSTRLIIESPLLLCFMFFLVVCSVPAKP